MNVKKHTCPKCNGKQLVPFINMTKPCSGNLKRFCSLCHGTGKVWQHVIEDLKMKEMEHKLKTKPPIHFPRNPPPQGYNMAQFRSEAKKYHTDSVVAFFDELNTYVKDGDKK